MSVDHSLKILCYFQNIVARSLTTIVTYGTCSRYEQLVAATVYYWTCLSSRAVFIYFVSSHFADMYCVSVIPGRVWFRL